MVGENDAWNFCYTLPNKTGAIDETEIVVPDTLQMGWCESPPFFCASSKTVRDVIGKPVTQFNEILPEHKFEHLLMPKSWKK